MSERRINANHFNRMPFWFKAVNKAWGASYPLGTKSKIDKDSLIKAARDQTGLKDLGPSFWDEPLERMIRSIEEEARLHPIGYFITRQRLVNLLAVRLRAEYYFKKHPEILEEPLYPMMIIIGIQRTGTTKLHRLLASDPDNRSLRSWEAINPAPLKGDKETGKERIKAARMSERALRYMSPGFFAIHPVEHLAPEEDVLLLDVSFLSTTPEATMHVPSYAAWLENTDQSPAYEYAAKLLKLLQWQRPAKRWVLKTPHHLEFLPLVKKYYGSVQFIWTHRNVYQSIPSFLSMVSYSRSIFSDSVSKEEVTRHWVRKIGHMLSRALEFHRENNHADQFTDVLYEDLVKDPLEVLHRIYSSRLTDQVKMIFSETEKNNPPGKYGNHEYSLGDFGIDEAYIDQYADKYRQFQQKIRQDNGSREEKEI